MICDEKLKSHGLGSWMSALKSCVSWVEGELVVKERRDPCR